MEPSPLCTRQIRCQHDLSNVFLKLGPDPLLGTGDTQGVKMPVLGPVPMNLRRQAPPARGLLFALAMALPGLSPPRTLTPQK